MKALIVTRPDGKKQWWNPKRMSEYVNCKIEYRDVTEQEIVDLKIPEAMVTVKIPIEVFMRSEEMQTKIRTLDLLYNGLDRRTMDGYLYIENIDTHDVPEYLSLDEYTRMKRNTYTGSRNSYTSRRNRARNTNGDWNRINIKSHKD